jgi:adenylate kinase family enzyme
LKRIAVIGNAAAGKTTLSRILAARHQLPLTHVDSVQFIAGMNIRPHDQSIAILSQAQSQERWIIDGYGPLDILQDRLEKAEKIIFIDLPLWRHYWWATKRQIKGLWSPRAELPAYCDDVTVKQTLLLFKSIWKVHKKMRPEMLKILAREKLKAKVLVIRSLSEMRDMTRAIVCRPT